MSVSPQSPRNTGCVQKEPHIRAKALPVPGVTMASCHVQLSKQGLAVHSVLKGIGGENCWWPPRWAPHACAQ